MQGLTFFNRGRARSSYGPNLQGRADCSFWEAVLWTVGYLLAQGVVLVLVVAVLLTAAYGLEWPDSKVIMQLLLDMDLDRSFLLAGATSLATFFVVAPAVRFREGRAFRERIGWRQPSREETIYALATVAPIAVMGDLVYELARSSWDGGVVVWPFAAALHETTLDHLYQSFHGVSFPALIVAMALAPAIAEELVFRGVLGRRLVARYGVTAGVLLTSLCFALAHGSIPHAIATLPIAVLLHLLYLETRTIWAPILVHFCNNLLAISMVRFQLGSESELSPFVIVGLAAYLGSILLLLHSREQRWRNAALAQSR